MRRISAVIVMVAVCIFAIVILFPKKEVASPTEAFIERWLKNKNGTLATYVHNDETFDMNLAKGRETLSETLGLWMQYALEKDDPDLFDEAYQSLVDYFLEDDGFVYWKLQPSGESKVVTNALIDDLRIIEALFVASDKWRLDYEETAAKMSKFIAEKNADRGLLTDYYERQYEYSSDVVTISYIDPVAIDTIMAKSFLNGQTAEKTIGVLRNTPIKNGFYAKSYQVEKATYMFDDEIHMVDQALVAYHLSKLDIVSNEFLQFFKQEMYKNGVIYGRYDFESMEPTVRYESPAVYGFLVMYCLEIGERELASRLYNRMVEFRSSDENSPFYGGYSVDAKGNTHIFDNVVPLLAERVYSKYSR